FGEWNKNWQAIAAEMSDYTKRSFEESTATLEKLMPSQSVEQAVEIQTSYAKRAYDDYMQQMSKIGGMYASRAKEAYKPVEKILQKAAEPDLRKPAALKTGARRLPGLFCVRLRP